MQSLSQSQIYLMFHRPGSLEMEMLAHSPSVQYDHTKLFSSYPRIENFQDWYVEDQR